MADQEGVTPQAATAQQNAETPAITVTSQTPVAETEQISVSPAKADTPDTPPAAGTEGTDPNQAPAGSTDTASEDADIIKNIVSTETEGSEEEAPELDKSVLEDVAPPKSITLAIFRAVLVLFIFVGLGSLAFFSSQLTDKLDFFNEKFGFTNVSKELAASNAEIIKLQTNLNLSRYLQAKAYLDRFSYDGDFYIQNYDVANSQTSSNADKSQAASNMAILEPKLKESFIAARGKLTESFTAPLVNSEIVDELDTFFSDDTAINEAAAEFIVQGLFETELETVLNEKASALSNSGDSGARRDYKNYTQTSNLIWNTSLKNILVRTDFDALTDEGIYNLAKDVNSLIVNDLSIIQSIKDARIKWSDIINEIDLRTITVDRHYTDNFYEDLGGVRYTSYDFDSEARNISIIGETKRIDTQNFTMIADLIDELNRSDLFSNGEMRAFSKSGSLKEGYTASLRLTLDLDEAEVVLESEAVTSDAEIPEFLLN